MERKAVIEAEGLSIGYTYKRKVRKVVHEAVDVRLFSGEVTSLLGLNGAGKSTLLRTLCGFQPALKGQVRIQGRLLSSYSQSDLSRVIGVVLTEKTNAGGISVEELVALGRHPYTGFFGKLREDDWRIVAESLEAVGMTHKATGFVSDLSDGERQKVMIAKVLAQQCPIIVLDEPTAFLDVTSRIATMELLHRLASEQGKAVLLSTHDLDLAIQMSDCLWLQDEHRPIVSGTPEDLILNGQLETFFRKENIVFNSSTGRLTAVAPVAPVGVTGERNTANWVGNALIRNGYRPATVEESDMLIHCESPRCIRLLASGEEKTARNIAELLLLLHKAVKEK